LFNFLILTKYSSPEDMDDETAEVRIWDHRVRSEESEPTVGSMPKAVTSLHCASGVVHSCFGFVWVWDFESFDFTQDRFRIWDLPLSILLTRQNFCVNLGTRCCKESLVEVNLYST
jgi:hypothetical protein